MDAGFLLMFVMWLFLMFAIPGAIFAIYKETQERTICSPLIVSLLVITVCMAYAFYIFTQVCFPVVRALFL
jgi:hypothetical protein